MKIAVLGDTHFGVRSDSLAFHKYFERFYQEVFFPYLEANKIDTVIQTGDLFDRRKFVNYNTLHQSKKYFFNAFSKPFAPLVMHTYPGNHDIYFRNTLSVNSIENNLGTYISHGFIKCYTKPTTVEFDGIAIDFIPWIVTENEDDIKAFIANSKSQICFGHFNLIGFEMEKGHVATSGWNREDLAKYELVISGHFHHKSTDGHIMYIGAPCEHTWGDYGDARGFHIFDTDSRNLEFVPNPFRIHQKISYSDKDATFESIMATDFKPYAGSIVKVVVEEKSNPFLFDTFIDQLIIAGPLDVSIVENYVTMSDDTGIDQADDTVTLINKTVDALDMDMDKDKLKNLLREVYNEALEVV